MPVLTRDKLPEWRRKTRIVDASELGEDAQVIVAEMSGLDVIAYESEFGVYQKLPEEDQTRRRQLDMMALVIDRSVVGEDHKPLFADGFMAVAAGLNATATWAFAQRIFEAAMELNGFMSAEGNEEAAESSPPTAAFRAA